MKKKRIIEILKVFFPVKREIIKLKGQLKKGDEERYDSEKRLLRVYYKFTRRKKKVAEELNKEDFAELYKIARKPELTFKKKRRKLFKFLKVNSKKKEVY